jgi:hypothetical protein
MKFYYLDSQNKTSGPVSWEALQELINQGDLDGNPMVVEEGGSEWKPFSTIAAKTSSTQTASSARTSDGAAAQGAGGGFRPTFLGDLVAGPLGIAKGWLNEDFINASITFFKKAGHYAIIVGGGLGLIKCIISAVKTNQLIPALVGIAFVVALAILQFTAIAFLDSGDRLIANTPDRVSSKSYLECIGLFALLVGIGFLTGGLFVGLEVGGMNGFVTIIIPCTIVFILLLYKAAIAFNPQTVNVRIEKTSAGDEAVGLLGFLQKSVLKLVPSLFFLLAVLGDLMILSSFLSAHPHPADAAPNLDMSTDASQFAGGMPLNQLSGAYQMLAGYGGILLVLLACLVPLLFYILFLLVNLIREVIQSILSLQTKSK